MKKYIIFLILLFVFQFIYSEEVSYSEKYYTAPDGRLMLETTITRNGSTTKISNVATQDQIDAYNKKSALENATTPKEKQEAFFNTFGNNINESFYMVLDIILNMRAFFINIAFAIGKVVFLISLCLAGLNYALTGSGLKDNLIKIGKAVLFFFIVLFAYPAIITWIINFTYSLAWGSVGKNVYDYFNTEQLKSYETAAFSVSSGNVNINTYRINTDSTSGVVDMSRLQNDVNNNIHGRRVDNLLVYDRTNYNNSSANFQEKNIQVTEINNQYLSWTNNNVINLGKRDKTGLFGNLIAEDPLQKWGFNIIAPASLVKIIFIMAGQCFDYSEAPSDGNGGWFSLGSNLARWLKGLLMAFFVIATGIFACLEYIICFIEFAIVSSIGIILFPFSIWEGSKFMAESFIKTIIGFFMKLLFVTISIFLLSYGYINIFSFFNENDKGFDGQLGEIVFIIFSSLLFFFICKSAPAIASSVMSGTPSLSASGAISAAAGAVGGALAVGGMAKSAISKTTSSLQNAGASIVGGLATAKADSNLLKESGGKEGHSFMGSLASQAGAGLTRSLLGKQNFDSNNSLKSSSGLMDSINKSRSLSTGGGSSSAGTNQAAPPSDPPNTTPTTSPGYGS